MRSYEIMYAAKLLLRGKLCADIRARKASEAKRLHAIQPSEADTKENDK